MTSNALINFVIVCVIVLLVVLYMKKDEARGWRCTTTGCKYVKGGEYDTKRECVADCGQATSFICDSNSQCKEIQGTSGKYSTRAECENKCGYPSTYGNNNYYNPLFPYQRFYPRNMYWSNYHGHHSGHHNDHHDDHHDEPWDGMIPL